MVSREMIALGMKGAALAALGEMPADFLGVTLDPLGERKEGVKLGESTLSVFFCWLNIGSKSVEWDSVGHRGLLPVTMAAINRHRLLYIVIKGAA